MTNTAPIYPKSRTEWIRDFTFRYGTNALFDVIRESRVGISNAFTDEGDMKTVMRTAQEMIDKGDLSPQNLS